MQDAPEDLSSALVHLQHEPDQQVVAAGAVTGQGDAAVARSDFDYSEYDNTVANELRAAAANIRARGDDQNKAIAAIGAELRRVREKLGHGRWGDWLKAEFELSVATAERYMGVAERLSPEIVSVTNLQAQTLYMLAAKVSAPRLPCESRSRLTWRPAPRFQMRRSGIV